MKHESFTTVPTAREPALRRRLAELGARVEGIEEELDSHHDPDWEDLATEREGDEVLQATGTAAQREIALIRAALGRIAEGTYGLCACCGAPIGEARLDIIPWTPHCRACAT